MASMSASRFAILTDDASDPFEKKKKKPASGATGGAGSSGAKTTTKKAGTNTGGGGKPKNNTSSSNKASGSQQQQQPKKKKPPTSATNNNNNLPKDPVVDAKIQNEPKADSPLPTITIIDERVGSNHKDPSVESGNGDAPEAVSAAKKKNKKSKSKNTEKPEKVKDEQWQEWQKRDNEFVTGSFESDLEAALMQSKLDSQLAAAAVKQQKVKTKPAPVPLTEFNRLIANNPYGPPGIINGFGSMMPPPGLHSSIDYEIAQMEQFRKEAQIDMEREKRLDIERAILKSRAPAPDGQGKKESGSFNSTNQSNIPCSGCAEKENSIAQLSNEKVELEKELTDIKTKFKKICGMLADAQLKDKAILLRDNDKLTQLNTDLNEQVSLLCSQLEQEKSKYSSIAIELRNWKASEQLRKRTQSHNEGN